MKELSAFLQDRNLSGVFNCNLNPTGGFVTFSNRNGNAYAIGLDAILECLENMKEHFNEFLPYTSYVEGDWRRLGSDYYTHTVPRSLAAVCFPP